MDWQHILLKNEDDLPISMRLLAPLLEDEEHIQDSLKFIDETTVINDAQYGFYKRFSDKSRFLANKSIKRMADRGKIDVEKAYSNLMRIFKALEEKYTDIRAGKYTIGGKLERYNQNPEGMEDFVAELKKNPLTKNFLLGLTQRQREIYRKIMEESVKGFTLKFKYENKDSPDAISRKEFDSALDSMAEFPKISRSGDNLVLDAASATETIPILRQTDGNKNARNIYDSKLRLYYVGRENELQYSKPAKVTESIAADLLANKKYTAKTGLTRDDYSTYIEEVNKSSIRIEPVNKRSNRTETAGLEPRDTGENYIADSAFMSTTNSLVLSPFARTIMFSDIGANWIDDLFGSVRTSSTFTQEGIRRNIITDIIEEMLPLQEAERTDAILYGSIPLTAFANLQYNPRGSLNEKENSKYQRTRDAVRQKIKNSPAMSRAISKKITELQRNSLSNLRNDPQLLLPVEGILMLRENLGKEIEFYDINLKKVDFTRKLTSKEKQELKIEGEEAYTSKGESIFYARVKDDNDNYVSRDELNPDNFKKPSQKKSIEQVRSLLVDVRDESTDIFDLVFSLIEKNELSKTIDMPTPTNLIAGSSIEAGIKFLYEMSEQKEGKFADAIYSDAIEFERNYPNIKQLSEKEELSDKEKEELKKIRRASRKVKRAIDNSAEELKQHIMSYNEDMLTALENKLKDIAENYTKYGIKQPKSVENLLKNLVSEGLLTVEAKSDE